MKTDKPKRKKAVRACFHCQKAHLTCDDNRPCERCVKRGLTDCHDGVRKKAKYLAEDESASPMGSGSLHPIPKKYGGGHNKSSGGRAANVAKNGAAAAAAVTPQVPNFTPDESVNAGGEYYNFGSKAANLEYSVLGNMLDSLSPQYDYLAAQQNFPNLNMIDPAWASRTTANNTYAQSTPSPTLPYLSSAQQSSSVGSPPNPPPQQVLVNNNLQYSGNSLYGKVTRPFSYTSSFHDLHLYLRSRFARKELIPIARAISRFRPSYIATTKTLNEDDLIFIERSFQRSLLEFEKFVAFSGTPTVIWRRTSQIALVGKEFSLLTGWSRQQLLAKRKFIVELMDDDSVLEYFRQYSLHAFGDSSSAMSKCTLVTPQGNFIKCSVCYTIKRDIFDIPMMIIGSFLPVLQ